MWAQSLIDLKTKGEARIPERLHITHPQRPVPEPPAPDITTDPGEIRAFFVRMNRRR